MYFSNKNYGSGFQQVIGTILKSCWFLLVFITTSLFQLGCKKLVEVDPPHTSITGSVVFSSDATAIAVLTAIYMKISSADYHSAFQPSNLSFWAGLSADELTLWNGTGESKQIAYYTNKLSSNLAFDAGPEFWYRGYENIYSCNLAIEELTKTSSLTKAVKQQLLGEAKFMRAFSYFYLTNLYGDVPLVISTDYKANSILNRSPQNLIYQQIIEDLKDAKNLLSENYLDITLLKNTTEKVRPNIWVASALLSRVYLYTKDWISAETEASSIIGHTSFYDLEELDKVFLKNSKEAIWQLQPVTTGYITNTQDGKLFNMASTGPTDEHPAYLSHFLVDAFEKDDLREAHWIGKVTIESETYYYPLKYKVDASDAPVTEYLMIFRLGEQYLIRAEARTELGKISEAQDDLNKIRNRANLGNTASDNSEKLINSILHERQVELFTELGHRWMDLKRTGKVSDIMKPVTLEKGGIWNSNWQLYPIPYSDTQLNYKLIQNQGYN